MKVERKPADFCVDGYRVDARSLFVSIVQELGLSRNRHLVQKENLVMSWPQPPFRLVGARGGAVLSIDLQTDGDLLKVTVGGKQGIQSRLADRVYEICAGMEGVVIMGAEEFYRYSYSHRVYP